MMGQARNFEKMPERDSAKEFPGIHRRRTNLRESSLVGEGIFGEPLPTRIVRRVALVFFAREQA